VDYTFPIIYPVNFGTSKIEALDSNMKLTSLGYHLCNLPVDARLGKMIVYSAVFCCLDPVLTMASLLTLNSKSIFSRSFHQSQGQQQASPFLTQREFHHNSDLIAMTAAYNAWREQVQKHNGSRSGLGSILKFCQEKHLDHTNLCMVEDIKIQLMTLVASTIDFVNLSSSQRSLILRLR
jgi:HrpA-like RNA helicase